MQIKVLFFLHFNFNCFSTCWCENDLESHAQFKSSPHGPNIHFVCRFCCSFVFCWPSSSHMHQSEHKHRNFWWPLISSIVCRALRTQKIICYWNFFRSWLKSFDAFTCPNNHSQKSQIQFEANFVFQLGGNDDRWTGRLLAINFESTWTRHQQMRRTFGTENYLTIVFVFLFFVVVVGSLIRYRHDAFNWSDNNNNEWVRLSQQHKDMPSFSFIIILIFAFRIEWVFLFLIDQHHSLATQLCSFERGSLETTRRSEPHQEAYVWFIFRFGVFTWSPNGSIGVAHSSLCGYGRVRVRSVWPCCSMLPHAGECVLERLRRAHSKANRERKNERKKKNNSRALSTSIDTTASV